MNAPDPKDIKLSEASEKQTIEHLEKMGRHWKDINKEVKDFTSEVDKLGYEIKDIARDVKKSALEKAFDPDKATELLSELEKIEKKVLNIGKTEDGRQADNQEIIKQYKQMNAELKKISQKHEVESAELKDIFPSIGRNADRFADMGLNVQKFGSVLTKSGGFMKGFGGLAMKAGVKLAGISKLLAGWPGVILLAAKAVWDFGMKVDEFVKTQNAAFARIRGPDIMTSNVKKQFKDFNKALFSMTENIRVGLRAEQVREFTESVYQAGLHLDRLSEGFVNYRGAVYIAAKASKTLGIELPHVGQLMTDMINEFRMNMDQVDETFVQVAFDAKRAGLSTDKFWTAVQNANASLAFYGLYIGTTSKLLAKMTETGVQGVSETAATVEQLTQTFKGMSTEQKASFAGLIQSTEGGAEIMRDFANTIKAQWEKRLKTVEAEINIAESKGNKEELQRLRMQQATLLSKIAQASEAAANASSIGITEYMPIFADRAGELITQLLRAHMSIDSLGDLQGENLITAKKILESQGINSDILMSLKGYAMQQSQQFLEILGIGEKGSKNNNSLLKNLRLLRANSKLVNPLLEKLIEKMASNDPQEIADAAKMMEDELQTSLHLDEQTAKDMTKLAKYSPESARLLSEIISGQKTASELAEEYGFSSETAQKIADLEKAGKHQEALMEAYYIVAKRSGALDKAAVGAEVDAQKSREEMAARADDTFQKIRDQTLSYKDMTEIAKDDFKWNAASLGFLQGLNTGVFGIWKHLLKGKPSEEEKVARAEAKKRGIETEGTAAQFSGSVWEIVKKLEQAEKNLKNISYTNDLLDKMEKGAELSTKEQNELLAGKSDDQIAVLKLALKGDKKALAGAKKFWAEEAGRASLQVQEQEKNLNLLKQSSSKYGQMVDYLSLMKDDASKKVLGKKLSEMVASGKSLKNIQEETGLTIGQVLEALDKTAEDGDQTVVAAFEKAKIELSRRKEGRQELATFERTKAAKKDEGASLQGLTKPIQIVSPEYKATLHRGEMVVPEHTLTGGMGAPGGRTIQINVTATERDLAQRIANEIRSVMYREQLTGAA